MKDNENELSVIGFQNRTKTASGMNARIQAWIFPDRHIAVRQVLFVEPNYEIQKHDIVLRATDRYKVVERCLFLTENTASLLCSLLDSLLNYEVIP